MAPHSSTLAWKIPWIEEPGGLQFMGSLRVGHDWSDTAAALFSAFNSQALIFEAIYTDTHSWEISWFKKIKLHLPLKYVIIQTRGRCPDNKLNVKLIWESEQYLGKKENAFRISLGSCIMSAAKRNRTPCLRGWYASRSWLWLWFLLLRVENWQKELVQKQLLQSCSVQKKSLEI